MLDRAELERLAREATPGPWGACKHGECTCGQVWSAEYPVAVVTRGKWGDTYPALRLVGDSSLEQRAEPYIEMIEYGEVAPQVSSANAALIVAAVNALPRLLAIAAAAQKQEAAFKEFAEFVTVHNKEQWVPWPIAELFVKTYRSALREALDTEGKT